MIAEAPAPGQPIYVPQGRLRELWESHGAPERIVSGPAGTGKSRGILEYLYVLTMLYPGSRGLIVRATRASLTESGLVTFEQHVVPRGHGWVRNQARRVRQSYELPNGSEIVVGGLDNTARIMSTEYDWIYVQETREVAEAAWEDLTTRLRNGKMPAQFIVGDTNPDGPTHWILERARAGKLNVIESRHEDNPILYDESAGGWTAEGRRYISVLDNLTGVRRKRLRDGLWVGAEGLVYEDWDPAIHVLDPFEIPAEWSRYRAVDFGFTNPFACLWVAEDEDGRLYVYRQLYGTQRTVTAWAHLIHDLSAGENIEATITDHDLESRVDLEAHLGHSAGRCGKGASSSGWTVAALKDVRQGIERVQKRLMRAGDGEPRLYVLRGSLVEVDETLVEQKVPTCVEEEFSRYVWAKARSQTAGEVTLEEPVKRFDHALDALRYQVMHMDDPRAPYTRALGQSATFRTAHEPTVQRSGRPTRRDGARLLRSGVR